MLSCWIAPTVLSSTPNLNVLYLSPTVLKTYFFALKAISKQGINSEDSAVKESSSL